MTTWTHIANEVSAAWSTLFPMLMWNSWEDEKTDDWENWG
jgi:hypothetical protein